MKTIIWDYNGTILDDVQLSVDIENQMLKERGLKYGYSLEEYKSMFNNPMVDYYKLLGYTFEDETFEEVGVEFYNIYSNNFDQCSLNVGILDKLKESKEKGYTNVILSSCAYDILVEQCRLLGITSYFDCIMGVDNLVGGSKIGVGKQWMEDECIDPKDCLFIGDTNADYETAVALQVSDIYLISNGHQSYERLKKLHDHVYHSIREITL